MIWSLHWQVDSIMFVLDISDIIIISLDFEGYALQCNR